MNLPLPSLDVENVCSWDLKSQRMFEVSLPSHSIKGVFSTAELEGLKMMYSRLYSISPSSIDVCSAFMKYRMVSLNSKAIGSHNSRCRSSSILMCLWHPIFSDYSYIPPAPYDCVFKQPARVNYFAKHTVIIDAWYML